jgi:hypothetical protein
MVGVMVVHCPLPVNETKIVNQVAQKQAAHERNGYLWVGASLSSQKLQLAIPLLHLELAMKLNLARKEDLQTSLTSLIF